MMANRHWSTAPCCWGPQPCLALLMEETIPHKWPAAGVKRA